MAIKHGISCALHDKWLPSLVINGFLETSNNDTDVPIEMKKEEEEENEIAQVTSKD